MDLPSIQATVERACIDINRPHDRAAALAVLEQFQAASQLTPACEYILSNSSSAPAQFQAAVALARQIRAMQAADREPLRVRILQLLAARPDQLENYVTSQLLRVLAVTLSAGCRDGAFAGGLPAMLTDIRNMVASTSAMQLLGLRTALAVLEEFEEQSSDQMAVAHKMLEESGAVLQLEEIGLRQLQLLADAPGTTRVLWKAALALVLQGLSWTWGADPSTNGREDGGQLDARCAATR